MLPQEFIATHVLDVILVTSLCWGLESLLCREVFSDYELWHLKNRPGTFADLLY